MKVIMVAPSFPLAGQAVVGGVQGVCLYLAQALRKLDDVDLEVVLPNANLCGLSHSCDRIVNGITVRALVPEGKLPFYVRILWQTPRMVRRYLDTADCDIVHFQGVAAWAQGVKKAGVLTVHGINEQDTLYRGNRWLAPVRSWGNVLTEGRARRKVRNVIAINPYVRDFLSGSGRQRIWDIPNPVSDVFFEVSRNPQPGRILCTAIITPLKNQMGLIKAFASVAREFSEAELRLAGSGGDSPYGQLCRSTCRELGISDRVRFLGSLAVGQVQEELRNASLVALASHQETAPLAISEAMAAAVPVVASNRCGVPWMVRDGVTGRLVDPENPEDIARVLRQMLRDDDLPAMGRAAHKVAEQNYRASIVAQRTVEVYRQITGGTAYARERERPSESPLEVGRPQDKRRVLSLCLNYR